MGTKTHDDFRAKEPPAEFRQQALKFGELHLLIDQKTFYLVEHERVAGIHRVRTIDTAGTITAMGGLCCFMILTCPGDVWLRNKSRRPLAEGSSASK